LPTGDVTVRLRFEADEPKPGTGGDVTLWANDKQIGEGRIDNSVAMRFSFYAGMDVGRDNGMTVDSAYRDKVPYPFTGTVKKVIFDLKPEAHEDEKKLHETAQHSATAAGMSGRKGSTEKVLIRARAAAPTEVVWSAESARSPGRGSH
jgi:arylsulfatase